MEDSSGPKSADETSESGSSESADTSEADSEESQAPMGNKVSKLFGLMGKMKSKILSPWAGAALWDNQIHGGDAGPHSPTEPASSESDGEPAGPPQGQQGTASPDPEYDPWAGPDGSWAGQKFLILLRLLYTSQLYCI